VRNTAREWTKHASLTMPLTNGCCSEDVIVLGLFCSRLLFWFVQMSDECFVHLLLACFLHDVVNGIQI